MPAGHSGFGWTIPATSLLVLMAGPASTAAETRGYVISMIHTATYGDTDTCPQGGNGGPLLIRQRRVMAAGYSEQEAADIVARGGRNEDGDRVESATLFGLGNAPNLRLDPGVEMAQGRVAYGFDLDGRRGSDSFEHPDTHELVDNQMWRVLGCFDGYNIRRPIRPYNEDITWDTAMDAMPAWLMSVSGDDLSQDGQVTVTFDRSFNVVMRDAHGGVLSGATYVIDSDPRSHSVFTGQVTDGVLTIEPGDFSMQGESQFYAILRFSHTQLRLDMAPDGSVAGTIGGYQPWRDYYHYLTVRGENDGQVDLPGVYHAMKRLADGVPDPTTGENTAISAAYWLEAMPAFHTTLSGEVVGRAVGNGPKFSGTAVSQSSGQSR